VLTAYKVQSKAPVVHGIGSGTVPGIGALVRGPGRGERCRLVGQRLRIEKARRLPSNKNTNEFVGDLLRSVLTLSH
jgi:hypothetical protein